MKRIGSCTTLLVAAILLAGSAFAQFARTEDAVKYRQSVMFVIGQHFTWMGGMLKGSPAYEKNAFLKNAAVVKTLAALPWDAFLVPGSDKGSKMKGEALKDPARFKASAQEMESALAGLVAAAEAGAVPAIQEQFGLVAKSCKACHGVFRK